MIGTCRARVVNSDDLQMLLAWRNHPNVRSFMFSQHEIGIEEHAAWFAAASQDSSRCLLIIEEHGEPFAYVQFNNVAPNAATDWGFYSRPNAPRGSGRKLGIAALNHAFMALEVHKVCGQAIATNRASIVLHQKLHFTQEGILRDQKRIGSVYHSLICFGLLDREWSASEWGSGDEYDRN